MPSFVPLDPETLQDQVRYTRGRLEAVSCLDCLAEVGVKKNSEHHTSIQWTSQARAHCPELARRAGVRDGHAGCPRMTASIEAAVRDGVLPVGAEDGW